MANIPYLNAGFNWSPI